MRFLEVLHFPEQGYVFPPGGWPDWADHNMWAPEIHFVSGAMVMKLTRFDLYIYIYLGLSFEDISIYIYLGRYLVYFSASAVNGRHSIGVNFNSSPCDVISSCGQTILLFSHESHRYPHNDQNEHDQSTRWQYLPVAALGAPMRIWAAPSSTTMRIAWSSYFIISS